MSKRPASTITTKMADRLVRKQVLLTAGQSRWLKRRAQETGRAESEIIREALDRQAGLEPIGDDWREHLMRFVGPIRDDDFGVRVAENKKAQADAWHRRLGRTRKALEG